MPNTLNEHIKKQRFYIMYLSRTIKITPLPTETTGTAFPTLM